MKAKKYSLQSVLNVRSREREEAARFVALRLEHLAQAENELLARRQNLERCREKQNEARALMNSELAKGVPAKGIVSHRIYLKDLRALETDLKSAVEEQKNAVRRAEVELEAARQKLAEAAKQLQAIEKHRENWLRSERIEESRKDRKSSDEIGSILHNRRGNT